MASTSGGGPLVADVEGLAIIRRARGDLLVASSQGNDSYATYAIGSGSYAGSYAITDGEPDGAEDTDGIDVSAEPLGPRFPHGLLAAQDGRNDTGNQSFKLVPLVRRAALDCRRWPGAARLETRTSAAHACSSRWPAVRRRPGRSPSA